LVYLALVQLLGGDNYLDETNTGLFFTNPGAAIIRTLLLQYMPVNTDVLPTFVLLHLAFPAALFLLNSAPSVALAGSILLYVAARQFGWNLPSWPHGEWYFNPLAWQALFVIGAWYATPGATRLKRLLQSNVAMAIATLYLAFGVAVALSWQFHALEVLLSQAMVQLIYPIDKSNLSPLRLFHFLALAVIMAQVLRHDWHGLMIRESKAIIRCGENSLPIYCLSVLLSFLGHVVLNQISDRFSMQVVVSFLGIAIMISAATLMTWTAKLDRRGPKLF
jgi:hypothetical protein